jgi:uncharacterized protein YndB with AHSA1/START domain
LKTKIIKQTVLIPASPIEVFDAYTDPGKQSEFTGSEATGKPRVGESFTAWAGYIEGKYLELKPGKRIVQEWRTGEFPEGTANSRLKIDLKVADGGTELNMVHSEVPEAIASDIEQGWIDFYWEPMKKYFIGKRV